MSQVARKGDLIGHDAVEGVIITAALDGFGDGSTVGRARVGDLVYCAHVDGGAEHGVQYIITGSPDIILNNVRVARIGDLISCGATILTASLDLKVD